MVSRLWNTYGKRFVIRVGTTFVGGMITYLREDAVQPENWIDTKAVVSGAIVAGFYALVALISPGEPHVGPTKTQQ